MRNCTEKKERLGIETFFRNLQVLVEFRFQMFNGFRSENSFALRFGSGPGREKHQKTLRTKYANTCERVRFGMYCKQNFETSSNRGFYVFINQKSSIVQRK